MFPLLSTLHFFFFFSNSILDSVNERVLTRHQDGCGMYQGVSTASCWGKGTGGSNSTGLDWTGALPCRVSLRAGSTGVGQYVLHPFPTGASKQDHILLDGVGFPHMEKAFYCHWPRLLLEQEIRLEEVDFRLEELEIASLLWTLALRAGHTCRTWNGLAFSSLGWWAVNKASPHTLMLFSQLWFEMKRRTFSWVWEGMVKGRAVSIVHYKARFVFDAGLRDTEPWNFKKHDEAVGQGIKMLATLRGTISEHWWQRTQQDKNLDPLIHNSLLNICEIIFLVIG